MRIARSRSDDGFSFLELVASLFILALLSAALTSSLHLGIDAVRRTAEVEHAGQTYFAQKALRQLFENARPVSEDDRPNSPPLFNGAADAVQFAADMPPQFGGGGLYRMKISSSSSKAGKKDLVLTTSILTPELRSAGTDYATIVLSRIDRVEIKYLKPRNEREASLWVHNWPAQGSLPLRIAIDVVFPPGDNRIWPQLIVSPKLSGGVRP